MWRTTTTKGKRTTGFTKRTKDTTGGTSAGFPLLCCLSKSESEIGRERERSWCCQSCISNVFLHKFLIYTLALSSSVSVHYFRILALLLLIKCFASHFVYNSYFFWPLILSFEFILILPNNNPIFSFLQRVLFIIRHCYGALSKSFSFSYYCSLVLSHVLLPTSSACCSFRFPFVLAFAFWSSSWVTLPFLCALRSLLFEHLFCILYCCMFYSVFSVYSLYFVYFFCTPFVVAFVPQVSDSGDFCFNILSIAADCQTEESDKKKEMSGVAPCSYTLTHTVTLACEHCFSYLTRACWSAQLGMESITHICMQLSVASVN